MKKRAVYYCRVSTNQEEQLASLAMQQAFFDEYFTTHPEYEYIDKYVDKGISGKSLKNRAEFNRMVQDGVKGKFDIILCKDISRFARNTVDLLENIRKLKRHNVYTKFITNDMTSVDDSEFAITIMAAIAQEESANLSKRIKFSKNKTAAEGRVPNFVFGYDRVDKYTLKPNIEEAKWVQKIFELYVNEGYGMARIAEYLNVSGVITKKKNVNAWTQHVIAMLLRNKLYIGKVVNKKSEIADYKTGQRRFFVEEDYIIIEREDFRIIDDDLFNKAQSIINERKEDFKINNKRASSKYPLSNLLMCSNDGYSFRRCSRQYTENGKQYNWWTCSYRNGKGAKSCNNMIKIDEEEMHQAIINFLDYILSDKKNIVNRVGRYVNEKLKEQSKNDDELFGLNVELGKTIKEMDKLTDLYLDGDINKDYIKSKLIPLQNKKAELERQLAVSKNTTTIAYDIESAVNNFFSSIESNKENLLQNNVLKNIFDKFIVHPNGFIMAVLKIEANNGVNLEIPFSKVIDDENVPNSDILT